MKHHRKAMKTKCSSSSFREHVNVHLQPQKENNISYSVHSDMNACMGATERSIYIPPKNRPSPPRRREILQRANYSAAAAASGVANSHVAPLFSPYMQR